jgi:hypothetical protein
MMGGGADKGIECALGSLSDVHRMAPPEHFLDFDVIRAAFSYNYDVGEALRGVTVLTGRSLTQRL